MLGKEMTLEVITRFNSLQVFGFIFVKIEANHEFLRIFLNQVSFEMIK